MRSTVLATLTVFRLVRTRCPLSAASKTISIVSRSRISPTRITFGACRNAARRANGNAGRIAVQLALVNRGPFVIVQELDGIFDSDDVADLLLVDAVEQRGQGRRLARAPRSRNQHNAFAKMSHIRQLRWQAE